MRRRNKVTSTVERNSVDDEDDASSGNSELGTSEDIAVTSVHPAIDDKILMSSDESDDVETSLRHESDSDSAGRCDRLTMKERGEKIMRSEVILDEDNDIEEDYCENCLPDDNSNDEGVDHEGKSMQNIKKTKVHKLSLVKTTDFNEVLKKRGVIYIARVPPRMTPSRIKSILSDFGEVTRIFLQEEDSTVRKRRKKNGGSGSKRYVEGWVEMSSKVIAKHVARSLHMTPISNHKRNPHYGDLWSLKYLPKFKWSHLTEKVAYERRVREQKLRMETLQARRETASYKQLVETGKKLDKIEERKRKRQSNNLDDKNIKSQSEEQSKKKNKSSGVWQVQPIDDGVGKPTKRALLGALMK